LIESAPLEAFFLRLPRGRRFCLFHGIAAGVAARGAILYIAPFAEEMNCARRVAAAQARAFAAEGLAVLQIDVHGCGDSDGDFSDADWDGWSDDLLAAVAWLRQRVAAPLWLWGLRAGCLLAAEAAQRLDQRANFLFWQPSVSGEMVLRHFLRLKIAGDVLSNQRRTSVGEMLAELASGQAVEVAGYAVSAPLAQGLRAATLAPPAEVGQLIVIETGASQAPAGPSPSLEEALAGWRAYGAAVQFHGLRSPPFWQRVDRTDVAPLIAATTKLLREAAR